MPSGEGGITIQKNIISSVTPSVLRVKKMPETTCQLTALARARRDQYYGQNITYSPKVFIPLTQLCRDVCHYCTFAKPVSKVDSLFMPIETVLQVVQDGKNSGCREVLLTLGEKPEIRYRHAKEWLETNGFSSTLEYVETVAEAILHETGLLPHINAGTMNQSDLLRLKRVSASMGLMLESSAASLCKPGGPHFGSPDKSPFRRWLTLARAGRLKIPMTTGLLLGIGETRDDRLSDLHRIRKLHCRYGHIQEVIIQNFRAKNGTKMATAREPDITELVWTIAVARKILPLDVSIQAPPNLNPDVLLNLLDSGINDWGGISPVTPDYVNPEAPWPSLESLRVAVASRGKTLVSRLTVYPRYIRNSGWIHSHVYPHVLEMADTEGMARDDDWRAGVSKQIPRFVSDFRSTPSSLISELTMAALKGEDIGKEGFLGLLSARGFDLEVVCKAADRLRAAQVGDAVSYVVNRNINYTNVCLYSCKFCAFSKRAGHSRSGDPYDLDGTELRRRVQEARSLGATEVCLQGGIHPSYTGETYLDILGTVKDAAPDIAIHAFSPLEIEHGASTLGLSIDGYLTSLKEAGLSSLPGTAAEILDDTVRAIICPDKISSSRWLEIMASAHSLGLPTTATIMFGHIEGVDSWAQHWLQIIKLQRLTSGFTECVPLPFVSDGSPIYRSGGARPGPTWREAKLMHAVLRLMAGKHIPNIQASWVKLGHVGAISMLSCGANDLGGVLVNESITRAAGASHGEYWSPQKMIEAIQSISRVPVQRHTDYKPCKPTLNRTWVQPVSVYNTPAKRRATEKLL